MERKKRIPGVKVTCAICGKAVYERGLKGHVRLKHHANITEVVTVTKTDPVQKITKVKPKQASKEKPWIESVQTQTVVISTKTIYDPINYITCKNCGQTKPATVKTDEGYNEHGHCDDCWSYRKKCGLGVLLYPNEPVGSPSRQAARKLK